MVVTSVLNAAYIAIGKTGYYLLSGIRSFGGLSDFI